MDIVFWRSLIISWLCKILIVLPLPLYAQDGSTLIKLEQDLKKLLDRVKPSVVTVSAQVQVGLTNEGEPSVWSQNGEGVTLQPLEITNVGSGIIFDSIHVVTHTSVIWDSRKITLTLADGREISAALIGTGDDYGIAVLQAEEKLGQPVVIRTNDNLNYGNYVAIVGNALGASPAVSLGIVNAIRNDGMIQISANIVAGNGGGPVFDSSGRLVGLLVGFISPYNTSSVISYYGEPALAYPIKEIIHRTLSIIHEQLEPQGWVGVTAEDWPGVSGWIHISDVRSGSPAEEAGLRIGDIIVKTNDKRLTSSMELAQYIRHQNPGGTITLGVLRGDSTHFINIKIGNSRLAKLAMPYSAQSTTSLQVLHHFDASPQPSDHIEQQELMLRIDKMEKELIRLRAVLNNR